MTIPQLRPGADVVEFQRLLQQGAKILDGAEVSVEAAATTAVQQVRHGLGRVYRGAFVVFSDQALVLIALDPAKQEDPGTYLYYQLSAATATRARLWCF